MEMDHAVQIMYFEDLEENGAPYKKLKYDSHKMEQILAQTQKNEREVSILAITGATRQGKSFFLSFLLRYLYALEERDPDHVEVMTSEPKSDYNWMEPCDQDKYRTFNFGHGMDQRTTGMWVWSKVFTLTRANGKKFDLILMDTQGVFDKASRREWSVVMGISLLVSSNLVFNLFSDLKEDTWENLGTFLCFGLMALGQPSSTSTEATSTDREDIAIVTSAKPFQRLGFLIRDWNRPSEFKYGWEEGQKFIDGELNLDTTNATHKSIRQQVRQSFDQIQGFLLPHPGKKAITGDFTGNLADLDEDFRDFFKKCVEKLMEPSTFPVKMVGGLVAATGGDILKIFDASVDIFNNEEIPEESLCEVTVRVFNGVWVNKCLAKCGQVMEEKMTGQLFLFDQILETCFTDAYIAALNLFTGSRKMGTVKNMEEVWGQFLRRMDDFFENFATKYSAKKEATLKDASEIALKQFLKEMKAEIGASASEFLEPETIQGMATTTAIPSAIRVFMNHCQLQDSDAHGVNVEFQNHINQLNQAIEVEQNNIVKEHELIKVAVLKAINEKVETTVTEYEKVLASRLKKILFDFMSTGNPPPHAKTSHEMVKQEALTSFKQQCERSKLYNDGLKDCEKKIEAVWSSQHAQHKNDLDLLVIQKCFDSFQSDFNLQMSNRAFFFEDVLQIIFDTCLWNVMTKFDHLTASGESDLVNAHMELKEKVQQFFKEISKKNSNLLQQKLKTAHKEAATLFRNNVEEALAKTEFLIDKDFTKFEEESLSIFQNRCAVTKTDQRESLQLKRERSKLQRVICTDKLHFDSRNKEAREEVKEKMDQEVTAGVQKYETVMTEELTKKENLDDRIAELQEEVKQTILNDYQIRADQEGSRMYQEIQQRVGTGIDKKFFEEIECRVIVKLKRSRRNWKILRGGAKYAAVGAAAGGAIVGGAIVGPALAGGAVAAQGVSGALSAAVAAEGGGAAIAWLTAAFSSSTGFLGGSVGVLKEFLVLPPIPEVITRRLSTNETESSATPTAEPAMAASESNAQDAIVHPVPLNQVPMVAEHTMVAQIDPASEVVEAVGEAAVVDRGDGNVDSEEVGPNVPPITSHDTASEQLLNRILDQSGTEASDHDNLRTECGNIRGNDGPPNVHKRNQSSGWLRCPFL